MKLNKATTQGLACTLRESKISQRSELPCVPKWFMSKLRIEEAKQKEVMSNDSDETEEVRKCEIRACPRDWI